MQIPGSLGWAYAVISPLYDSSWNMTDLVDLFFFKKLTISHEAIVDYMNSVSVLPASIMLVSCIPK